MNFLAADLASAFRRLGTINAIAYSEVRGRYRRSFLGPMWLVLGNAISIAGLSIVWSVLLGVELTDFVPSLSFGLITWQFVSSCIIDAPTGLTRQANLIKNLSRPYSLYMIQILVKNAYGLFHNLLLVIAIYAFVPQKLTVELLLIVPGLALVILNLAWIVALFSLVGARFRDFDPLISASMPILFFLSPVIYRPQQLGYLQEVSWINPLAYFISLIRDPLIGVRPSYFVYVVAFLGAVVGLIVAAIAFRSSYKRIAFWM